MLIDTHTHLYDLVFDEDRAEVIARARENGVAAMMLPAIDSSSHKRLFELAESDRSVFFPMMGLHPTSVNDNPRYRDELCLVEQLLAKPPCERFYAIGEIGLDLYWSREWRREQEEVFARQIELSLEYGLPVVIHTRDCWPEMLAMLGRYRDDGLRGVMHSFSGSYEDYCAVGECGDFLIGVGGVATYKKSLIADILPRMSLADLVLETDSPYLSPVPYRGKRNESGYLAAICAKVSDLMGVSTSEVARVTSANAVRMFGLPYLE